MLHQQEEKKMSHDPREDMKFLAYLDHEDLDVRVDDITVPPYQRVAEDRVHILAKRLPFQQFQAPRVDIYRKLDGTLISLNGAGRQWLARHSGVEFIQARVFFVQPGHFDLTDENLQVLVEVFNDGSVRYTKSDKFDSRLTVGLEPEVTIARTLAAEGLSWQKKKEEGRFFSASTAYLLWDDGTRSTWGPEVQIKRVIDVMIRSYGQLGDSNNPQITAGVSKIFRVNGQKVNTDRLVDIIRRSGGPLQLLAKAQDLRGGHGAGQKVADHLIKLYNSKLPPGMLRLTYVSTALRKSKKG